MTRFDRYRDSFPNARLTRSKTGVLEVALHTDGSTLEFNGHTHEQFVDLFHAIGSDPDNRVVILTGSGGAFMETISPEGFDFFTPQGYDKIYREGRKVLMNILDIEVPLIAAVNGPVRLHSEYILLADIVLGRVDGFDQDEAESKRDERAVILRRLLASKCDTLEAFELADRLFDACPCLVECFRKEGGHILGVGSIRDCRTYSALARGVAI